MSCPYRADSNIADLTDLTDLTDPTDPTDLTDPTDPTDPASCLLQRRAFGHRKANINHNRDGCATF
jgi:hypothetical protein